MVAMPAEKFSISTSPELFEALEALAEDRDQDRSSLIEMLLREHPMVEDEIRRRRGRGRPRAKRGRDEKELDLLARTVRSRWQRRKAREEVEIHRRG